MPESKVYILGAGCSKDCGYPLGAEMKADLEQFGRSLDSARSPRLQRAVADTVELFGTTTETIDVLVQKLYGGNLDEIIGGPQNRHPRVISATLATCAAFLVKEASARATGFRAYREFLSDLFPNAETQWLRIPQSNRCHVLTFNYDRLFEMAFVDRFIFSGYGLYDVRVLNSGVTLEGINIKFTPEAFSFLKLHGSVGGWTVDWTGTGSTKQQICYFEAPVAGKVITVDNDYFFSEGPDGQHPDHLKKPPLLFFPYQRQYILSTESGFAFDSYAREVWKRATELISNATDIHVIGYSFSGIDREPMLKMLDQAHHCRRLVIQGLDAERICYKLKLDRPQLGNLIQSVPIRF
ncbi:MAG TPA: hypothetical protein VGY91_09995 [Chthoniobacterales bacterium]|jgi:hypothetical protein|nr:hypothetical protein [Chthoniobacterales bacterium]